METLPGKKITRTFRHHHLFTLSTSRNNLPWCAPCFYVYDQINNRLVFTSDHDTRHIDEAIENRNVSGAIALETRFIGKIRGIQFSGTLRECVGKEYPPARKLYLHRFPYTIHYLSGTALWELKLTYIKMTDNRMGFGKKLIWCKNS